MEHNNSQEEAAARAGQAMKRLNEGDRFCQHCGIRLTSVGEGCATGVMPLTEQLLNGWQAAQGGAIFTLADFTFAGAANSYGGLWVVQNASIAFVRPGLGSELRAEAVIRYIGRRSCMGDVRITNDAGKLVAQAQYTGCLVGE
ncbi:MAG: PaaI family thioesterase [Lentisphaeria bacterium]|nr:PaaI family thioesterase [Lentisphaeria bacterium]